MSELRKYQKVWKIPGYGKYSPGETCVKMFRSIKRPTNRPTLIDLGCGVGRASIELQQWYKVTQLDFVDAREKKKGKFLQHNLTKPIAGHWDYGYCCDVMEHIPPSQVDRVLRNIKDATDNVFFQICFVEDHFGQMIGEHLHLSVHPFTWWRDKLREYWDVRDARDQIHTGIFFAEVQRRDKGRSQHHPEKAQRTHKNKRQTTTPPSKAA